MDLSNIKNAMYRGYTYTRDTGKQYIHIKRNSGYPAYIIAVFKKGDNNIVIVESIDNHIISVKNINDSDVNIYMLDDGYSLEAESVTVNYFSPVELSISSLLSIRPDTSLTVPLKTLYFSDAIKTGRIELEELEVDYVKTGIVSSNGSIEAKHISIGNWELTKKSENPNRLYIKVKEDN